MDVRKGFFTGQPVLVRDNITPLYNTAQKWEYSIYAYYDFDENQYITINGYEWDQCIPYEGNEKLLGTYENPSEE